MVGLRANAAFSAINIATPLLGLARDSSSPLRPGLQAELDSLTKESDPELFYADLYRLGRRIEKQRPDFALALLGAVAKQAFLPDLAEKARRHIDALEGRGWVGARSEVLLTRFIQNSFDPLTIAPMLAGSAVFGAVRAASAARLLGGSGWASRGLGLRLASGLSGYLAEVPSFVLASRALRKLGATELNVGIGTELASVAITLSALKFAGAAVRGWNLNPSKLSPGLSEASTFGGLLLAHSLESQLGLRPASAGSNLLLDTLASAVSLGLGSRLGQRALGPRFASWQRELNLRGDRPTPPALDFSYLTAERLAIPTGSGLPKPPKTPSHIFAMSGDKGDAESWTILAENIATPEARERLANLPPADPIAPYRWLAHPSLEVRKVGQRILEVHRRAPEQEALALHHLAMAIAEGKYPVTGSKLELMQKMEDVIFGSKAFEEIFGGISQGMASDQFRRFTQNLAPLYRGEAADFLKAIRALNRSKKINLEFLKHWNDESHENPYRFYRKSAHRIKQRWHREAESDPNTVVGMEALRQSLIQPRTFSADLLLARATENGKSFAAFIEENLPLTLSGLRAFLPGDKITLSPDYAFIPIERLLFQPYHFAVKRTHVRNYQRSIARNAVIPAIEVLELKDGRFLLSEGHHRSTAAYFENADFIKVRLLHPEELTSRPNIGPFKEGSPIPLKWIVVDDAIYNHYNDLVGPSVRLEIGPRLR